MRDLLHQQPDDEAHHRMARIEASVRRMNDVIDGMLGLAQLTKVELVRKPIRPVFWRARLMASLSCGFTPTFLSGG